MDHSRKKFDRMYHVFTFRFSNCIDVDPKEIIINVYRFEVKGDNIKEIN